MKLGTTGRSVRNDALVERSVRRSRVAGRRVHTGLAEIGTTREEEREAKSGKLKSLPPLHEVKMPPRVLSSYFDTIFNLDFLHKKK